MAGERGPKDEPSFDTQALLGVSDAELHETRGRRAPRRSPKGLIAAAVGGVLVVTVGLVLATRGGPEVVKLGPPDASASPQAAGALPSATPTPSASGAPASVEPAPDPRASLPPVVVPVAETEPTRAPRTTRDREAREREAPASKGSRVSGRPTGPDDVDRAMERLAKQTGDQHAAAGAREAARVFLPSMSRRWPKYGALGSTGSDRPLPLRVPTACRRYISATSGATSSRRASAI